MSFTTGDEAAPYYHHPTYKKSETHETQALISWLRQISVVLWRGGVTNKQTNQKEEEISEHKLELGAHAINFTCLMCGILKILT